MVESSDIATADLMQNGLELPAERQFYFNGYLFTVSPSDVTIVLLQNDQPVALLNTSHTLAKTLTTAIEKELKNLEEKTGQRILTTVEISAALSNES